MLRITKTKQSYGQVKLLLEGKLEGRWVPELEREIEHWLDNGHSVTLDFGGVKFVGGEGARMLKRIASANVKKVNCSELVERLLSDAI